MRVWYVLMATFISLMIAMVILLGGFGDIQGYHWAMPYQMNSACDAFKWHLAQEPRRIPGSLII